MDPTHTPSNEAPDYISIPEPLKLHPIEPLDPALVGGPRLCARLRSVLQQAGVQLLGELDGKRLSDFEEFRQCGAGTLWALRSMILRALQPGVEPDLHTRPIPMRAWWTTDQIIEIAPAIVDVRTNELPLSVRLAGVLQGLGVERLGQLHGLTVRQLLVQRRCGRMVLAELVTLLGRAEAGEFTLSEAALASITPADLLREIDDLVSRLPEPNQTLVKLHFGASGQAPYSLGQLGKHWDLTGSAVGQRLLCALDWLRRHGSLKLQTLLDHVEGVCARTDTKLSAALVLSWQDPARPFRHIPQFYVGLISKLREARMSRQKPTPPPPSAPGAATS
jgi:hypothetical protein